MENQSRNELDQLTAPTKTRAIMSQQQSPLLRLPAEIRNAIYHEALDTATVRFGVGARVIPKLPSSPRLKVGRASVLSLVCRQIYHESKAFLRTPSKLDVKVYCAFSCDFDLFMDAFEKIQETLDLSGVRELEIDFKILRALDAYRLVSSTSAMHAFVRPNKAPDRSKRLFCALEVVVLPTCQLVDTVSQSSIRFCFGKPSIRIELR